ncbi:Bug family tripartite tricarboxylate transporter substrate binding protein [Advenella kashmirensis]|uniref:Bug family tripartite tricarboxylate transporter substrate binding protein n=1 Tax=Advenella kashmirensis TaxID=310575 RepID=UPI00041C5422|nr:tripartite tricarboxylate transporter substrate binding protein [Advenella kashmirensis]
MILLHRIQILAVSLLTAILLNSAAQAKTGNFPDHALTLILPFPAGGAADGFARPFAQALGKQLGQAVVVENLAGANGGIGSAALLNRPADGYTMLIGSQSTLAINPSLYANLGYDPIADFQPVTLTHQMANVLVVNKQAPFENVKQLVDAARKKPGDLSYASAGNGNTMHLAGEEFQIATGTRLLHVPYKGGPPALNDVLAGRVPMMFNNLPAIVPMVKAGRLRAVAIADSKRSGLLPDVPTMKEAGVGDFTSVVWNGVVVRKGTPTDVLERLHQAMLKVLKDPAFRQPLEKQGFEVLSSTPEEFSALLEKDTASMAALLKKIGMKID